MNEGTHLKFAATRSCKFVFDAVAEVALLGPAENVGLMHTVVSRI